WLERLPDSIKNWESLIELDISWTRIKELPDSMGNLKNLKLVKMTGSCISKIPDALWTIEKLEEIKATDNWCLLVKIGNGIYRVPRLRILRLKCAQIYTIPKLPESLTDLYLSKLDMKTFPDLSNLINLKELDLRFGPRNDDVKSYGLVEDPMPWWIGKFSKLKYLGLECDYVTTLPTDISLLPQLKTLDLHCSNLRCLPRLPSSLSSLFLRDCMSLCSMDLSDLEKLSSLMIWSCPISEIRGLDCLENLQKLQLSDLGQVKILPDLSDLNELRSLDVRSCGNLVEIQGKLPQSLEELEIRSCESLRKLPDLSSLKRLQKIVIEYCMELNVEAILCFAQRSQANLRENLQNLRISDLGQVEKLLDLSNLNKLSSLDVRSCVNLVEIEGELTQSLKELEIHSCESLQKLPDVSSLNKRQMIDIDDSTKLNVKAIHGSARRNRRRRASS
ncbi:plant intracellular Ras-group-related LRR protein 4-like, partial [Syzygium oleosum]|uniref:plant intracellular Ras-group-related LRR protein 4-like n=1 Tax=Syzygium oleosum TaxID=219896 RepID=UPI0024BB58E0